MRIEIQLKATGLKNIAKLFKGISDPKAVVTLVSTDEEIGRTESVKNNLEPEWCTPIYYEYPDTGEHIFIKVAIYDDNRGKGSDELMGDVKFDLKEAIDHPERTLDEELETGGIIKLHAIPSNAIKRSAVFQFRALDVENVEKGTLGLGRSDPYLIIYKKYVYPEVGNTMLVPVWRSEVVQNHLNPCWKRDSVNLETFCDGNLDMDIIVKLFDWGKRASTYIGHVETTLRKLLDRVVEGGNGDRTRALHFKSGYDVQGERSEAISGMLIVLECKEVDED